MRTTETCRNWFLKNRDLTKTIFMKLLFLFILLCGITSTSNDTAKQKKVVASNQKAAKNFDMVPSGLIFQF
jgi:hypothetical protein